MASGSPTTSATDLVDDSIAAAIACGASDIHITPQPESWEVWFRCDGVLTPYQTFPRDPQSDPAVRLMAMAGLPTYRSHMPQEASLRIKAKPHFSGDRSQPTNSDVEGPELEMRLGIFPTLHGHRAAIRITRGADSIRDLDRLGLDPETLAELKSVCQSRDGLILMAGPAGSGKTTTLYACLCHLANDPGPGGRSILTIEDPVEAILPGVHQCELPAGSADRDPTGSMTLAQAMRSAVRQDAEVLLVSEIRDPATADAVLSASLTGHLCFSSIHSSSVGTTLRRLAQMDLPHYAIASGLSAIVCTRLIRSICDQCRSDANAVASPSCPQCRGSGYAGRIPLAQLIRFDGGAVGDGILDALTRGQSASQIDSLAIAGGIPRWADQADRWLEMGRTDRREVIRVLGPDATDRPPKPEPG